MGGASPAGFGIPITLELLAVRYLSDGVDRLEALARLSMDLGHGDGRERYCAQVYLKNSGAA